MIFQVTLAIFADAHNLGLVVTARTESLIASAHPKHFPAPIPSSSSAYARLSHQAPLLVSAVEQEASFPEDAFEASVCLGWLYWIVGEPFLALSSIPSDVATVNQRLIKNGRTLSGWTHVCIVRGAYARGQQRDMALLYGQCCY